MKPISSYKFTGCLAAIVVLWSCSETDTAPVNTAPIPRIIKLQPEHAAAGDEVSIIGVNFSKNAGENEVKFNQTIVEPLVVSDTLIKVVVPDMTGSVAGISVRSHGKISNKRNLSLVRAKVFADDFNRADVGPVDGMTVPNPLGQNWQIVTGAFALKGNKLFSNLGGSECYMFYRAPDVAMNAGNGSYFKLTAEIRSSPESFAGVIFNAQNDNKRFYLLRTTNTMLQLLKTGVNGLGDWAAIMINDNFAGFAPNTDYHVDISSSQPGRITIKVSDVVAGGVIFERTVEDPNPYTGGSPGFYYFGLANPVDIAFDNFRLETL